ncbi:MAG: ABC transporter permease, partial [Weeksellaceae bacterium]|nr:ABC transporter permease [Weeksellaceae bacterium]
MIQNWIKVAFRNFAKNKLATFINTFGLTIGLVGLILTILYQYDQFSYDRWIPEKDRIFAVGHVFDEDKDVWGVSNPQMEKAKANISEIEEILLVSAMGYED